ncbi:ShlB/FhaC/HecB family hemolysin secretion/activation protein [Cupriavidus pampae]|uniref:Hemolysin transporter protein ShlB n=1 Tax=Cupriavidus pampae TaxID=659251 RepID=A0ABM8XXQ3_9BURK|nr:ShlB/FhaC/HecB family hemolysin secretion/activation protein [Cupriavidus pampae]CAG9185201.1 Hemolysin transporter protein ShlB [Cupriavidus pampae]
MPIRQFVSPVATPYVTLCATRYATPFATVLGAICAMPGFATHALAQQGVPAQAQPDAREPSRLLRRDQIIENQQQERLQEDQERALRALPDPEGADLESLAPRVEAPEVKDDARAACREVRHITIGGDAQRVPADLLERIRKEFEGRCLGAAELGSILTELTRHFIVRGEVTTRAYLPAPVSDEGDLEIKVVEGVIERYDVDSDRARAIWPRGVFPARPGDLLNLRDLEQAVEQINRLSSNDARLELHPGSAPGQTVVRVQNRTTRPLHLYASLDNLGTKATGRNALSATITVDSLLGFNELFALTRRQSVFPLEGEHRSEATALQAQVPYGYHTFSAQWSRSSYLNTVALPRSGRKLAVEGRTDVLSVGDDRVVYRDGLSRVSVSGRISLQSGETWLAGQSIGVASRDFTFAELGVGGTTRWLGGISTGRVAAVRGLAALGAYHDPAGLPDDAPHAQFQKFTMGLSHARRLRMTTRHALIVSAQFTGQYSLNTLYGSQQILIGGPGSVRGFLNHTLAGDHGYYARAEASLPWQASHGPNTVRGRFYAGIDWGTVVNRNAAVPSGALTGVAIGMVANWRALSIDASVSRAVRAPSARMREGTVFGVRVSCAI